jgi:DNA processing protein
MRYYEQKDFANHPLLARLLTLHDIPKGVYIEGELPSVTIDALGRSTPRILTIVGSRKNTTYGRQVVEKLLEKLKDYPIIILSGLALGIDGIAHKEALKNNLKTIAIPGSGLGERVLYPSAHRTLAKDIVAYGGALLSEYEENTQAAPWTFPNRNRLMASLSDALLIIEAEEKSGTLITARLALELGKDIGAIPGEIFSPNAEGTNILIKNGAYLISEYKDLLSLLHLSEQEHVDEPKKQKSLSVEEQTLLDLLIEPLDKDTLFEKANISYEEFITHFSSLEINGYLQETFGEVRRLV